MKRLVWILTVVISLGTFSSADSCFNATGKAFKDAQTLRKIVSQMGWKIGKFKSITAGGFIKSKKVIYPEDELEVCIKVNENQDDLIFKAQSKASDAEKAIWRRLFAKKQ